jgi:hypothetical protein
MGLGSLMLTWIQEKMGEGFELSKIHSQPYKNRGIPVYFLFYFSETIYFNLFLKNWINSNPLN